MTSFYAKGSQYFNDYFVMSRHIKSVFTLRHCSSIGIMEENKSLPVPQSQGIEVVHQLLIPIYPGNSHFLTQRIAF